MTDVPSNSNCYRAYRRRQIVREFLSWKKTGWSRLTFTFCFYYSLSKTTSSHLRIKILTAAVRRRSCVYQHAFRYPSLSATISVTRMKCCGNWTASDESHQRTIHWCALYSTPFTFLKICRYVTGDGLLMISVKLIDQRIHCHARQIVLRRIWRAIVHFADSAVYRSRRSNSNQLIWAIVVKVAGNNY